MTLMLGKLTYNYLKNFIEKCNFCSIKTDPLNGRLRYLQLSLLLLIYTFLFKSTIKNVVNCKMVNHNKLQTYLYFSNNNFHIYEVNQLHK